MSEVLNETKHQRPEGLSTQLSSRLLRFFEAGRRLMYSFYGSATVSCISNVS